MAIQENSLVSGQDGHRYRLEKEIGAGGEGRVYRVAGENLVAKIYKKPEPDVETKIRYMVSHPIPDLLSSDGSRILTLAWPRDILRDDQGAFIGYTMPFVGNAVEICTIARGCDMPGAKALFPDYDWLFNLRVAIHLAEAVAYLHSRGCVIGDLNCKNIMVSPGGVITLLDNDSFDMRDATSGLHFRCCAGTQDYLAPELQGRNLRSVGAVFSPESDDFALAIHIFQLLMNNYHPFTGKNLVVIQNSTSVNQRLDHLVNGKCPFIHTYSDLTVPIGAPYLNEMMPPELVQDFYRTFDYSAANITRKARERTTAAQWAADLKRYLELIYTPGQAYRCATDGQHFYLARFGRCGLCAARERLESYRSSHTPPQVKTVPNPPPAKTEPTPPAPQTGQNSTASGGKHSVLGCLVFAVIAAVLVFLLSRCDGSSGSSRDHQVNTTVPSTAATTPPTTVHVHDWSPATYERPEYCPGCGEERGFSKGYVGSIHGEYRSATINGVSCVGLTLDTTIQGMRKMSVSFYVNSLDGHWCEDWDLYAWDGERWVKIADIFYPQEEVPEGSYLVREETIAGDGTMNISGVAMVPGDYWYNYELSLSLYDVQQN